MDHKDNSSPFNIKPCKENPFEGALVRDEPVRINKVNYDPEDSNSNIGGSQKSKKSKSSFQSTKNLNKLFPEAPNGHKPIRVRKS